MTKSELLERMKSMGACRPATEYVKNHASDDAQVIWQECYNEQWLMWYSFRVSRVFAVNFARRAAERAKKHSANAYAASYAAAANAANAATTATRAADAANAAYYAANAAYYAAANAANAAYYAREKEVAAQLKRLRAWKVR